MFDASSLLDLPLNETISNNAILLLQRPDIVEKKADELLNDNNAPLARILFLKAISLRSQGNVTQALKFALSAHHEDLDDIEILKELGFCYRQGNDYLKAINIFEKIIKVESEYAMGWKALSEIFAEANNIEKAEHAKSKYMELYVSDFDLSKVPVLLRKNKINKAAKICQQYLKINPNNPNALRMMAQIAARRSSYDNASELLEKCLVLDPSNKQARLDYAKVLLEQYEYDRALEEIDVLLRSRPRAIKYLNLKGTILSHSGQNEEACKHYQHALTLFPKNPALLMGLGFAQRLIGNQSEAIASFRTITSRRPQAYVSLANLKKFTFMESDITEMKSALDNMDLNHHGYVPLCFALGKAYEDKKEFDVSFKYYKIGNDIKKQEFNFNPEFFSEKINEKMRSWDSDFFSKHAYKGCMDAAPIFILGLPRSGSTLLEQILASHSKVDGTMELGDIAQIYHKVMGPYARKGECERLSNLESIQFCSLGEKYIERTMPLRKGAPYFIDKMPGNFLNIGFIHLILPNAKFIDARRHPMGAGLSNYKQLYSQGQAFTYDLEHLAHYYNNYVDLMEHWQEQLPERILHVQYEEVVGDFKNQVRRILDFCGLSFEDACLEFYNTKRPVRTVSSEQVRLPIYSDSVEQWQHFEKHLSGLINTLKPKFCE